MFLKNNKTVRLILIFLGIMLLSSTVLASTADYMQLFLPITQKGATATPSKTPGPSPTPTMTLTPTPSPTPVMTPGLVNPGFENNTPAGWAYYASDSDPIRVTEQPRTGAYSARLANGSNGHLAWIEQTVEVPVGQNQLVFFMYQHSEDECYDPGIPQGDRLVVLVNNQAWHIFPICADEPQDVWIEKNLDLSSFAGLGVILRLEYRSDSSVASQVYTDDFGFIAP